MNISVSVSVCGYVYEFTCVVHRYMSELVSVSVRVGVRVCVRVCQCGCDSVSLSVNVYV